MVNCADKRQCDRIKPCQACCVRGLPSECEYVTTNEDRFLISQADAIESLRSEVGRLKQRLADLSASLEQPPAGEYSHSSTAAPAGAVPYEKYAALQSILKLIASGSPDVVANTVAQVRSGAPLEDVAAVVRQLDDPAWDHQAGASQSLFTTPSHRG